METTTTDSRNRNTARIIPLTRENPFTYTNHYNTSALTINDLRLAWVYLRVMISVFLIGLKCYRSISKAWKAGKGMQAFRRTVYGNLKIRRCVRVNGKYHFGIYVPSYPSRMYDDYVRTELNKIIPHDKPINQLQAIQLAITNKCPLQCEHCFEWNNLNLAETFTTDELKKIVDAFQLEGCTQIYFTGGEPLVKMNKLEELIRHASNRSECWVLTSGLNLTPENATGLKNAGAMGVIISLDHHDAAMHNTFRRNNHAFDWAMQAVKNANEVKLVTAFSICVTRSFISKENLMMYAELAKDCGVSFVQILEPKAVGHYNGKPVTLSGDHLDVLEKFYIDINFNPKFNHYPVFVYHGYHERKIGCQLAGKWSLYIDSAGFINACTFCQTKFYDAHDIITDKLKVNQIHMNGCPAHLK